jgi:Transcriptional regulator, AbiEi antitoxin
MLDHKSLDKDQFCARMAVDQHGLFTHAQAMAAGLSPSDLYRRLAAGRLELLMPSVFGIAGIPWSWRRSLMAACLWSGAPTAASHRSAAAMWRWEGFRSSGTEISTTCARRPHGLPLIVHRVDKRLVAEISQVDGIPVTSPRRTLLDLAGFKHPRTERALDEACLKRQTSLESIWMLYEESWMRGRRGVAILRSLLVERTPGEAPTQGDLEALFRGIVRNNGLPEPVGQLPVQLPACTVHLDFAYPERTSPSSSTATPGTWTESRLSGTVNVIANSHCSGGGCSDSRGRSFDGMLRPWWRRSETTSKHRVGATSRIAPSPAHSARESFRRSGAGQRGPRDNHTCRARPRRGE